MTLKMTKKYIQHCYTQPMEVEAGRIASSVFYFFYYIIIDNWQTVPDS